MESNRIERIVGRLAGRRLSRRTAVGAATAAAVGALGTSRPRLTGAQPASPVAGGITVAAAALTNPRGLAWDASGTLYVALAGTGGPNVSPGTSPQERAYGRFHGGSTASVAKIVGGCPITVAGGLPSAVGASGSAQGATGLGFLAGTLYVLEDGAGPVHGNPESTDGIYRIEADGSHTLVADISSWMQAHPVAHVPWDYDPDGETFGLVAGAGALWVSESNSGQILRVTPQGAITRVADLSDRHPVPTAPAMSPKGGVYVGFLTLPPYKAGASRVVEVAPDGSVTEVWTGLTMVTAVAVGADGTLYAAEMATGNTTQPPYVAPGTGKVVRQTGRNSAADVAVGLDFPIALGAGPDGALYVSTPAYGAPSGGGSVLRIPTSAGNVLDARQAVPENVQCAGGTPTMATPNGG